MTLDPTPLYWSAGQAAAFLASGSREVDAADGLDRHTRLCSWVAERWVSELTPLPRVGVEEALQTLLAAAARGHVRTTGVRFTRPRRRIRPERFVDLAWNTGGNLYLDTAGWPPGTPWRSIMFDRGDVVALFDRTQERRADLAERKQAAKRFRAAAILGVDADNDAGDETAPGPNPQRAARGKVAAIKAQITKHFPQGIPPEMNAGALYALLREAVRPTAGEVSDRTLQRATGGR